MRRTIGTLVVAAILGAIGYYFFGFGQDPTPLDTESSDPKGAASATATGGQLQLEDQATVREVVPAPEDLPSWLDHPFSLAIDVFVVDRLGLPVKGHTLRLGPPGCPLNEAIADTGADGHAVLSWGSRQSSGEVVLADRGGTRRRVALQHGKTATVTVVREPRRTLRGVMVGGGTVSFTIRGLNGGNFMLQGGEPARAMKNGLHPHAVFTTAPGDRQKQATNAAGPEIRSSIDLSSLDLQIVGGEADAPVEKTRIAGTVFGEDGKPAAKVAVALLGSDHVIVKRTETDDGGQFVFEDLRPAEFTVRAGGDEEGLGNSPAILTTGTTPVTVHLVRDAIVRGRAEALDGGPIQKARVSWQAADGSWGDETETGDDGSFTLANLPATPGTVMLWEPGRGRSFPLAIAKDVLCNAGELLLREPQRDSELRIEPVLPDNLQGAVSVRVWDLDTGVGIDLRRPRDGAIWRLPRVRAGWYQIEISHRATGTIDGGRHWVDGKADCDLGVVTVPPPATATLVFDAKPTESERAVELYRIREDLDVHVAVSQENIHEPQFLEPGDYAVLWHDAAEKLQLLRFTSEAGKAIEVRIPR